MYYDEEASVPGAVIDGSEGTGFLIAPVTTPVIGELPMPAIIDPSVPFRLAVIGCGQQGRKRGEAAKKLSDEGVELVGVVDPDPSLARQLAAELEVRFDCATLEQLLEQTGVDGVIVTLPAEVQAGQVNRALRLGLRVLCEAPFGRSEGDARLMANTAAREGGLVLATGYLRPVQVARSLERVDDREIGTTYLVQGTSMCSPKEPYRGILNRPDSLNDPGGWGAGADLAADLLSVGLRMLGSTPVAVSAQSWDRLGNPVGKRGLAASASMSVTIHCQNGAAGVFSAVSDERLAVDQCWVHGQATRSTLVVRWRVDETDPQALRPTVVGEDGLPRHGEPPMTVEQACVDQLRNFVRACCGREDLASRPKDAILLHQVLGAILQSVTIGAGTPITIDR